MSGEEVLRRQLERERRARRAAEALLEDKSRELYEANRQLEDKKAQLEQSVDERTAELVESEARIRAIVDSAADAIITIDSSGVIDSVNPAATRIFGYHGHEVVGRNVSLLMPEPHRSRHDGYLERYLGGSGGSSSVVGVGRETMGLRKDGTVFPIYLSVSDVEIGDRHLFTGIIHDLSERYEAEQALERAREREAAIGGRIQQALLFGRAPTELVGLEVAAMTIPSQSIDGDFIDFFPNDDMSLDLLVGDVMGKGILAALVGAGTKAHFLRALHRLTTGTRLPRPDAVVNLVDKALTAQLLELETFVTVLYARVSAATGKATIVDCGHTGALFWRGAEGRSDLVTGHNLPMGVIDGEVFRQIELEVAVGDILVFFSDGITEARGGGNQPQFGLEGLQACVAEHHEVPASDLVERVCEAVVRHTGSEQHRDDLTCIVIRVIGRSRAEPIVARRLEVTSDRGELTRVRAFIGQLTEAIEAAPAWSQELATAVHEAVANIIRHGYRGRSGQPVVIEGEVFSNEIAVTIRHRGVGLKRSIVPNPALDGSEEGGFGLYLIHSMVDRVAYFEDAEGFDCTLLIKRVEP